MNTILYVVAMRAEAMPFIEDFGIKEVAGFFDPLPCRLYSAEVAPGKTLHVVLNGEQHDTDLVGCEAASVSTLSALQRLNPDLVINSGTCGGFISRGAKIADVYIGNSVIFHDRRVPGDDAWSTQSIGNYPVWEGSQALAEQLGFKMGKVTTGSSLDLQPCDAEIISANGGDCKDMEGAAVGFVCSLYKKPLLYVKSVTDLCDGGAETIEEFRHNLATACEALRLANKRIICKLFDL